MKRYGERGGSERGGMEREGWSWRGMKRYGEVRREGERGREGCKGEKTERGAWARVVIPSSPLASLLAAQPGPGSSLPS